MSKTQTSDYSQPYTAIPDLKIDFIHEDSIAKLAILPENSGPVFIDFSSGKKAHRRQFGGGKGQPIARALGITSKFLPKICDATAGMGSDSFVFASLGCEVLMIEKCPPIAQLLADGLKRALEDEITSEIVQHMHLVNADASQYLAAQRPEVDVIYLDPMYPEKKKSAAPKKEMKLLQTLVGPDLDSDQLLEVALSVAKYRVVVKRPKGAPYIGNRKPNAEITSPNTRYDIYVIRGLPA